MRISDWSSDVCSSDLHELEFQVGVLRPLDGVLFHERLLLAAAAEEADPDRGAVGPQLRDLECGEGMAEGHAEPAACQWPGPFRGEHAVDADLLEIRSEEHTYELQ